MEPSYEEINDTKAGQPEKFSEDASEEELVDTIDSWVSESRSYHDMMLMRQNQCVRYYLGNQTDLQDVPPFNSNSVYNRIFESTETIVPIVAGTAHQFLCVPGEENEKAIERAKKMQTVLSQKYEDLEMPRKIENAARDAILKRFGVLKYFWDSTTNDVNVKVVDPRLILIPKMRCSFYELPYVLEIQDYTRDEIEENFPDVNLDDLVTGRGIESVSVGYTSAYPVQMASESDNHIYQVFEAWTDEYVVWKQGTTILKRMVNPNFDFEGSEEKETVTKANGKIKVETYRRFSNFLDRPEKPYVVIDPFVTGDSPVADTSITEVALPIQDDINVQKRKIIDNLVRMGNGQVYVDSDSLTQEEIDQITNEPGLVIVGKNLASENRIRREAGISLPNAHFANLQDSIAAFDNVFGTHASVRGQGTGGTLGGQVLDKQQDLSRIDQLTRCVNRAVTRVARGITQLMKLYYTQEQTLKILGPDGTVTFLKFTQRDIDQNAVIRVKSGNPVQLDPQGRYNQAIQLWQLNAIDPETLYTRLDFADPQEAAQKLQAWRTGQLLLESQIKQAEAANIAAVNGEIAAQTEAAGTGGAPAPQGERGVETPGNAMTRAMDAMNAGGKAPLSNTPNGANPSVVA